MFLDLYNYWVVIVLMMIGLFIIIAQGNLVKKVIGLNLFQTSIFIFFISSGKIRGGTAPILSEEFSVYSSPLPHVLILTAIVVGIATTALALSLCVRIKEKYNTLEEQEITARDN